jgi:hypothetical protein
MSDPKEKPQQQPSKEPPRKAPSPPPISDKHITRGLEFGEHQTKDGINIQADI